MDLKKLNEELDALLEREESQEFKDFMQSRRDAETSQLQKRRKSDMDSAIYYNQKSQTGDDWYAKEAETYRNKVLDTDKKINSKKRDINKIYKELGDRGLDINNAEIKTIPLAGKTSANLNKLLKSEAADPSKKYYLITPYYEQFRIYSISVSEGKLFSHVQWSRENTKSMSTGNDTLRTFMQELNNSKDGTVYDSDVIFLVIADSTAELRRQRADAKSGTIDRALGYRGKDSTPGSYHGNDDFYRRYGYTDRSGYYVDMNNLRKRLDDFKRQKGGFEKPIQDAITRLDNLLNRAKEEFNNIQFGDDNIIKDFNTVLRNLKSASRDIDYAKKNPTTNSIKYINDYLDNAEKLLDK